MSLSSQPDWYFAAVSIMQELGGCTLPKNRRANPAVCLAPNGINYLVYIRLRLPVFLWGAWHPGVQPLPEDHEIYKHLKRHLNEEQYAVVEAMRNLTYLEFAAMTP